MAQHSSVGARRAPASGEQLLPPEVSYKSSFWFGRARSFPIFSPPWYRLRARSVVTVTLLFVLTMTATRAAPGASLADLALYGLLTLLPLLCLALLGPALALWVRQQQWQGARELAALAAALAAGIVVSGVLMSATNQLSRGELRQRAVQTSAPTAPGPWTLVLQVSLAVLACGWLGGGFDLLAYQRQRRKLAAALMAQELAASQAARSETEMRLAVLAAQIEPHFLFNTLAGVRSAIAVDPARATAIVDHLVDYLRATIPQMRSASGALESTVGGQLDAARAYLALMQARMPRLAFGVHAEAGLTQLAVPPLLLISLVENAIKHGVEPKIGPARIEVDATIDADGQLALRVADDGVGFGGTTSGSGIGIANINARLAALYGKRASLTLKARPGGGVEATIRLPINDH